MRAQELLARCTPTSGGCLVWTGAHNGQGYARQTIDGRVQYVRRFIFQEMVRPLAPGEVLRHSCDNPPCCAPEHQIPGTQRQNAEDMLVRGRATQIKYGPDLVEKIRREYATGRVTQRGLAERHGVSQSHISRIVLGQTRTMA